VSGSVTSARDAAAVKLSARSLVPGQASGTALVSDAPLSFWGGVDPATGVIIDRHHPLHGQSLAGRVLAIPGARGSCTGSAVLLELILNGTGPAALIFPQDDSMLSLGAIIAEEMFGRTLPVLVLAPDDFARLCTGDPVGIVGDRLTLGAASAADPASVPASEPRDGHGLVLTDKDRDRLAGGEGEAARVAMRIILRMARIEGARELIDVTQGHIDGCIYTGPASLLFAERFRDLGGRVVIPTTLNAISVDERRWQAQGIAPAAGQPAVALAHAYVAMGARPTFTCAPYQLESAPGPGEDIVWAESNAVVYANSVIGARTAKYPDFLDLCIALTGRAPRAGCHIAEHRRATVRIDVEPVTGIDDLFYALLGHHVGALVGDAIPVICGLDLLKPSHDDLRAFAAAFATTSGAPMFHWLGATPEARDLAQATQGRPVARQITVMRGDLLADWRGLNSAATPAVDLIAIGNPHASLNECRAIARLVEGRGKHPGVALVITCSRAVMEEGRAEGLFDQFERFGATIVNDTCWCMITEPVIPPSARVIATTSGKYAHYGPGLVDRAIHFRGLADCIEAACEGHVPADPPLWLVEQ
jgi:predicted aconitase/predicted aconitase with swiveling domain